MSEEKTTTLKETKTVTERAVANGLKRLAEITRAKSLLSTEEMKIRKWLGGLAKHDEGTGKVIIGETIFKVEIKLNRTMGKESMDRLKKDYPAEAKEILTTKMVTTVNKAGAEKYDAIAQNYMVTKPSPPTVKFV